MEHVLIATATMDKKVSSGIANLFSQVSAPGIKQDYKFSTMVVENVRGFALMRNMVSGVFLKSPCDRLWFLDNDVLPAANVLDLLDVDGDVVAGVVPFQHCTSGAYLKLRDLDDLSSRTEDYTGTGTLLDVTCVGTACTWIRREVLEDPKMHLGRDYVRPDGRADRLGDEEPPSIFRYNWLPNGDTMMGEDFDFSYRASRLGYRVRYDGRVVCDHVKTLAMLELLDRAKQQWDEARSASISTVAKAI